MNILIFHTAEVCVDQVREEVCIYGTMTGSEPLADSSAGIKAKLSLSHGPTAADFLELLDFWGFNEGSREGDQL